jgi:hypothetical protein
VYTPDIVDTLLQWEFLILALGYSHSLRHACVRILFQLCSLTFVSEAILQIYAKHADIPEAAGLFNPENDKDACGVGFVAELSQKDSRATVKDALEMLVRMTHRGACGCEVNTGQLAFL